MLLPRSYYIEIVCKKADYFVKTLLYLQKTIHWIESCDGGQLIGFSVFKNFYSFDRHLSREYIRRQL